MDHDRWALLLAPMDCAGEHEGEERAPDALMAAGLREAVDADDVRTLATGIGSPERDPDTGVIGLEDLQRSTVVLREAVGAVLRDGRRPLVVGGDCAIVPGIMAGARDRLSDFAVAFVDGHLDALDGRTSPTGEAADMDLAIMTGHGPAALEPSLGRRVLVAPGDVAAVGFRADAPADVPLADGRLVNETALVDPAVHRFDARRFDGDRDALAHAIGSALGLERRPLWLHLDVDVLDERALPAVSYPQPGGPDWDALEELLLGLTRRATLVGAHVTCLNADGDPDGTLAARLVGLLGRVLGREVDGRGAIP